jgi:hypothetical protein
VVSIERLSLSLSLWALSLSRRTTNGNGAIALRRTTKREKLTSQPPPPAAARFLFRPPKTPKPIPNQTNQPPQPNQPPRRRANDQIQKNKQTHTNRVPAAAKPALSFLASKDFKLEESALYKDKLAPLLANKYVSQATGWKELPELINGRLAMVGFLAGGGAELFGAGPLLKQAGSATQPVLIVFALLIAASVIPVVKGGEGDYSKSLDDFQLPKEVFSKTMELVHGRAAMAGLAGMLVLESLIGRAVL